MLRLEFGSMVSAFGLAQPLLSLSLSLRPLSVSWEFILSKKDHVFTLKFKVEDI